MDAPARPSIYFADMPPKRKQSNKSSGPSKRPRRKQGSQSTESAGVPPVEADSAPVGSVTATSGLDSTTMSAITEQVTKSVTENIRTEITALFSQLSGQGSIASNLISANISDPHASNNNNQCNNITPAQDPSHVVDSALVNHVESITGKSNTNESGFISTAVPIQAKVSDKIKAKIWSNQYIELSTLLSKPNKQSKSKYALRINDDDESGKFTIQQVDIDDKELKNDISLNDWVTAWNRFAAIYCTKFHDHHLKLAKHMETVRDIADVKGDWRLYDTEFRQLIAQGQVSWGDIHMELYVNARLASAFSHKGDKPYFGGKNQGISIPKGACYAHHSGKTCKAGTSCKYQHSCFNCGQFHPFSSCTKPINRPFRVLERFAQGGKSGPTRQESGVQQPETKQGNPTNRSHPNKS